jgi:biofilm PGA synthesis N-glycosyltransferase PgaC
LNFRRIFEPEAGKHRALNTALESVATPLVVTVDADTLLHPDALTYLVARVTSRPQDQHVCACAGRWWSRTPPRTCSGETLQQIEPLR